MVAFPSLKRRYPRKNPLSPTLNVILISSKKVADSFKKWIKSLENASAKQIKEKQKLYQMINRTKTRKEIDLSFELETSENEILDYVSIISNEMNEIFAISYQNQKRIHLKLILRNLVQSLQMLSVP